MATLERQYQRLNQMIKWSVLLAWLSQAGEGDKLRFLEEVKVRRDFTFGNWTSQRPGLRFTKWSAIGLRPPGTGGIETESLPLLSAEVTSGGVSLAFRHDLKLAPLHPDIAPRLRRSTFGGDAGAQGLLKPVDGTAFRFSQREGAAIVAAMPKHDTKLRAHSAEFAIAEIEQTFTVNGSKVEVHSKVGGKPVCRSGADSTSARRQRAGGTGAHTRWPSAIGQLLCMR